MTLLVSARILFCRSLVPFLYLKILFHLFVPRILKQMHRLYICMNNIAAFISRQKRAVKWQIVFCLKLS